MKRFRVYLYAAYSADVYRYFVDAEDRSKALQEAQKRHGALKRPAINIPHPDDTEEM